MLVDQNRLSAQLSVFIQFDDLEALPSDVFILSHTWKLLVFFFLRISTIIEFALLGRSCLPTVTFVVEMWNTTEMSEYHCRRYNHLSVEIRASSTVLGTGEWIFMAQWFPNHKACILRFKWEHSTR